MTANMYDHTPAPWWPVNDPISGWSVKTYRDHSDMTPEDEAKIGWKWGANICSSIGDHTEKRTTGNEAANAALIAAAPDLLRERDALKAANAELVEVFMPLLSFLDPQNQTQDAAVKKAIEAINKHEAKQ